MHGVAVWKHLGDDSVSHLVVGDDLLFLIADQSAASFGAEPFKEGLQTGSLILGIFIAVFAIKAIIKLFEHLKEKEQ